MSISEVGLSVTEVSKNNLSIYVHIPFCNSKCAYCSFVSMVGNDEDKKRYFEDLVAEIGFDMSHFPSEKHLASWAGVCPGNNESAGKKKWRNHSRKQTSESGYNRSRMGSDPYQEHLFQ